jgi:thiol-disulfide isomerase/thioredoxin
MTINGCKKSVAIIAVICLAVISGFAQQVDFAQVKVQDLTKKDVQPLQKIHSKAVVFLFVQTDCPISNRYAPEINRLYKKYASGDVTFRLVYPDKDVSVRAIRRHLKIYGYKIGVLLDPRHELVKATGVSVTPEAAVFIASDDGVKPVYRGRIDDLVVAFGKSRPAPSNHDLEEILDTAAIGCTISDLN